TIITGDFNAHHPWWNSTRPARNADSIITVADRHSLHLLNIPDVPTYILRNGNGTSVLDLTFTTPDLHSEVDGWSIDEEALSGSDHLPVRFNIYSTNVTSLETPLEPKLNWKKADWEKFDTSLRAIWEETEDLFLSKLNYKCDNQDMDDAASILSEAIHRATTGTIPTIKLSPRSKIWWNEDLDKARPKLLHACRHRRAWGTDSSQQAYKEARNSYFHSIRKAKQEKWTEFLENSPGKDIFQVLRY